MVREKEYVQDHQQEHRVPNHRRGLVVGNYCNDMLIRDDKVIEESVGGVTSFVSNVLDSLKIQSNLRLQVGLDFAYSVSHTPILVSSSSTTLFHAYLSSDLNRNGGQDRILKRVRACEPIISSDLLHQGVKFDFGLAIGVGGEILLESLERMLDVYRLVFVDIQALTRVYDHVDGIVKHVGFRDRGLFHLLSKIEFVKASAEETPFVDV